MSKESDLVAACILRIVNIGAAEAYKRLADVQGPEQGLVGESRSDGPTCHAEAAKPGERGVGEIGGAVELMGHIERKVAQGQRALDAAISETDSEKTSFYWGWIRALHELQKDVSDKAGQRSDLSND